MMPRRPYPRWQRRHEAILRLMVDKPHLMLALTAYRFHEHVRGRVIHVVERQGAPLLHIVEVRPQP